VDTPARCAGPRCTRRADPQHTAVQDLYATGGGALKFASQVREALGVELQPQDEMRSLINGLNFLLLEVPYEVFSYSAETPMRFHDTHLRAGRFPYLLVNIGSGVSILKVHAHARAFTERKRGTHIHTQAHTYTIEREREDQALSSHD
jgi:pantothenate kinase